jgi:7-keto-8-aminopelargonate synthetase-like enzyme
MPEPVPLQQINRTYVRWKGRTLSYFGGCDYFRLASHPKLVAAVRTGLGDFGLNVAASRLTTGNNPIYAKLESALAKFFRAPSAVLVGNGYATNSIVAQALQGSVSRVVIDEKAHSSLRDASLHFRSPVQSFKHRDAGDLARVLSLADANDKPIVLTDGLFAHNGAVAPLADYAKLLPPLGLILLDDAHGAGVLGANGRGAIEFAGLPRHRVIQTITLSKAFGVYGGAILCEKTLREKIFRSSSMFAGSTPLPPALACAAVRAIEILRGDRSLRQRLKKNIQHVKDFLREKGFPVDAAPTPIIAFTPTSLAEAAHLRKRLLARNIFPSFIRYPGGPPQGYFRFALSSEHTAGQRQDLMEAITSDQLKPKILAFPPKRRKVLRQGGIWG